MPWVRLDDGFPDHWKLAELGDYAPLCGWLYVCGLAYCNRQLTDGKIPKAHVPRLASFRHIGIEIGTIGDMAGVGEDIDAEALAEMLNSVGLWEDFGAYWLIHDYEDYQPTKAQIEAERAGKQAAGRAGGQASAQARATARALAGGQAKFKPVPVPVPVPVPNSDPKPYPSAADAAESRDAAFRDSYGTMVVAFGGNVDQRLADEFTQIAEDFAVDDINDAIAQVRRSGKRCWPSEILRFLPEPGRDVVSPFKESRLTKQIAAAKERMA